MPLVDPSMGFLCHACPHLADITGEASCLPSQWLAAGYAQCSFADGSTGWQKLGANGGWASAEEVTAFYRLPAVRLFLQRLADTFAPFFPLSAAEWEADLRGAPSPITLAYLWQTTADEFDFYTKDKRFSVRARREYLDTLWLFFHHGPEVAGYQERDLHSLTLGRVQRVVAELDRYFRRHKRCVSAQS